MQLRYEPADLDELTSRVQFVEFDSFRMGTTTANLPVSCMGSTKPLRSSEQTLCCFEDIRTRRTKTAFGNVTTIAWRTIGASTERDWLAALFSKSAPVTSLFVLSNVPQSSEWSSQLRVFIDRHGQTLHSLRYDVVKENCDKYLVPVLPLLPRLKELHIAHGDPALFLVLHHLIDLEVLIVGFNSRRLEMPPLRATALALPSLRKLDIRGTVGVADIVDLLDRLLCPSLGELSLPITIYEEAEELGNLEKLCTHGFIKQVPSFTVKLIVPNTVTFSLSEPVLVLLPVHHLSITARSNSLWLDLQTLGNAWTGLRSFNFVQSSGSLPQLPPFRPSLTSIISFVLRHTELRVFRVEYMQDVTPQEVNALHYTYTVTASRNNDHRQHKLLHLYLVDRHFDHIVKIHHVEKLCDILHATFPQLVNLLCAEDEKESRVPRVFRNDESAGGEQINDYGRLVQYFNASRL